MARAAVIVVWVALALAGALITREVVLRVPAGARRPGANPRLASRQSGDRRLDCDQVLSSRWSSFWTIDLAALGLAFFVASLTLLALSALLPGTGRGSHAVVALVHLAAAPLSLLLIAFQIYPLGRLCLLCLGAHGAILTGAVAGTFAAGPMSSWSPVALLPALATYALLFFLAMGLLVPLLRLRQEAALAQTQLAWIKATPLGALVELLGRPRLAPFTPPSPFVLGDGSAPVCLDAVVDPACASCPSVVEQLAQLVDRHPADVHVRLHLPSRDPLDHAGRALRIALTATASLDAFMAAHHDGPALLDAAAVGTAALLARLSLDAGSLRSARAAQAEATALGTAVGWITPTVLLAGRPWQRPLWELDLLLACHPDLFASLRTSVARVPDRRRLLLR